MPVGQRAAGGEPAHRRRGPARAPCRGALSYLHRLWRYRDSVVVAAAIHGSPATSSSPSWSHPASGWSEASTNTRGSSPSCSRLRPGAAIGGGGGGGTGGGGWEGDIGATVKQAGRRLGQLEGGATGR